MSRNTFGICFKVTTFGESHGPALGCVIDGVPAGLPVDAAAIQRELDRRRPGQSEVTTARRESDTAEILSGVFEGVATGTPLAILIRNCDQRSRDYGALAEVFRPGHADYGYFMKYGRRDYRGGGRSSGRETAARVAAGAVARQLLATLGVKITAYALEIAGIRCRSFDREEIERNPLRSPDADAAREQLAAVRAAWNSGDSTGGVVECVAEGLPAGWGEPVFDKLDARLAQAMFSLGAVKGVEFGDGFEAARRLGSENNDAMTAGGFLTNHAGGVLGGISTGQPLVFRIAVKPTPSISREQNTVDQSGGSRVIAIAGRHDPCIVPRIVPVVEAMTALVLADLALLQRTAQL